MSGELERGVVTKLLNYKGVVYFRVPVRWLIDEEDDGEVAIYEDRDGSGTLRPWTEEYTFGDQVARDAIVDELHIGGSPEDLNDRMTLSYVVHDAKERGELLRLHRWTVTIRKGGEQLRVVTFTHTVESARESTNDTKWELQAIGLAVRNAHYTDAKP